MTGNIVSLQSCTGLPYNSLDVSKSILTTQDYETITVNFPDSPNKEFRILDSLDNRIASGVTDATGCGTVTLRFPDAGVYTVFARVCDSWSAGLNQCSTINVDTMNNVTFRVLSSPVTTHWLLLGAIGLLSFAGLYFLYEKL